MPTANLQTITVTFNWDAGPKFTFAGNSVAGALGGKGYLVNWVLSTASTGTLAWGTTPITWNDNITPPALVSPWTPPDPMPPAPNQQVMNSRGAGTGNATYGYKVSVVYNDKPYTSSDPELVLQPPG